MKKVFCAALLSLLLQMVIFATSYIIPENYIINPVATSEGIIVTNEYESAVYLISGNELELLFEAPGCGRSISLSPDGSKIGFKLIDELTGLQAPAYYDLKSRSLIKLNEPVKKCGQVDFDSEGNIYYTIGKQLVKKGNNGNEKFDIGTYSNLTPVSHDGRYVIVNKVDQLYKYDLLNESTIKLTDDKNGYYNSSWSPDGKFIAFQSVNANVYVLEIETGDVRNVGKGENPRWSANSNEIIYFNKEIDFNQHILLSSEIFSFNVSTNTHTQITDTPDEHEMNPSFNSSGAILYDTFGEKKIKTIAGPGKINNASTLFELTKSLNVNNYNSSQRLSKIAKTNDLEDWVHIHQVFDTRDSGPWTNNPVNGRHQGYLCCGATTAMEAIASYRILPPKPISTYGHTSEYGVYISDEYEYDGHVYTGFTTSGSRPGFMTGAHGYMWNAGGSPSSNATQFLRNHGINAQRYDNPSWSQVKAEIDAGYPYVLCTTSLTDGHIVLGIGQYGDGQTLYCNDPYGDKNAGNYGGIHNGRNAVYDWGDENTGHIKITPVVWGITARYDRTLPLVSSYPKDGHNDVSPSSLIILDFNNPLNIESLEEYVVLFDEFYNTVPAEYNYTNTSEGKLIIEPNEELKENSLYKVYIDYRTNSINGLQFEKNSEIEFRTSEYRDLTGTPLDDFECDSQFSLSSFGVVNSSTSVSLNSNNAFQGTGSAEIKYEFESESSSGYVRALYNPEIPAGMVNEKFLGVWVYGDCSNNNFEIWFSKENGNIACPLRVTLNWSGWKYISAELEPVLGEDSVWFNSFAIRQNSSAELSGLVLVDYLTLQEPLPVVQLFSPSDLEPTELDAGFSIEFNKPMDKAATESAIEILPSTVGGYHWEGNNLISFIPGEQFLPNTLYSVRIGLGARDTDGNNLKEPNEFSFKTKRTGLFLKNSYPSDGMQGICRDVKIILAFDEHIDRNTLYGNILFTDAADNPVDIFVDGSGYHEGKVMFEPVEKLDRNKLYKVHIKTGVKDTAGLSVPADFEISFTTLNEEYAGGNIIENFESVDNWIQPVESDYSIGIHNFSTKLSRNSTTQMSGDYSAKLVYKFTGVRGRCTIEPIVQIPINASGNVGLWVKGDYSFNGLRFSFSGSSGEIIDSDIIPLDWTGWKLVSIDLSNLSGMEISELHCLSIIQTDSGKVSSEILLDDLQTDIILPVEEDSTLPVDFSLQQNYPNPFNPTTTINFSIADRNHVKLNVYDILGREVVVLIDEQKAPGRYSLMFDAKNLASGLYIIRLKAGSFESFRKMMLLK
jgi:hypothetical protein